MDEPKFALRMIVAGVCLLCLVVASAAAQDTPAPAQPAAPLAAAAPANAVTDIMIINSCGDRLAKMFTKFGVPSDLTSIRGDKPEEDDVFCDYGAYGFRVRGKVIRICFSGRDGKGQSKVSSSAIAAMMW